MALMWDSTSVVGLVFNIMIIATSFWGYRKRGEDGFLYTGIAFAIFAISYIITLLGFRDAMGSALVIIRIIAYLIFVFALYKLAVKRLPEVRPAAPGKS